MANPIAYLPFEKEIQELEASLARLEAATGQGGSEEIRRIRRELTSLIRKIYNNLTAWDTVLVSRHNDRPQTVDYVNIRSTQTACILPGMRSTSAQVWPASRWPCWLSAGVRNWFELTFA